MSLFVMLLQLVISNFHNINWKSNLCKGYITCSIMTIKSRSWIHIILIHHATLLVLVTRTLIIAVVNITLWMFGHSWFILRIGPSWLSCFIKESTFI